jgi:hypothetical protein
MPDRLADEINVKDWGAVGMAPTMIGQRLTPLFRTRSAAAAARFIFRSVNTSCRNR